MLRLSFVSTLVMAFVFGLAVLKEAPASAQTSPATEFRSPDAIEVMPTWLKDAPFDVAKFFSMPPRAENAAPLYLQALGDASGELVAWLPADRRPAFTAASKARSDQWSATIQAYGKDPASVPPRQVDALLAAYADAFHKLDQAQARPRCVFATGISIETLLPHAQSARNLVRILAIRAGRSVQRDDLPAAIQDVERTLRVSRDIRLRGPMILQLVAAAVDQIAVTQMLPPILASRKLKTEQCDRLLKILADHEAQAPDLLQTGLMGEYVIYREMLRTFGDGMATVATADGRPRDQKLDDEALKQNLIKTALGSGDDDSGAIVNDPNKLAASLAQFRQAAPSFRVSLDAQTKALLAAPATFSARMAALKTVAEAHPTPDLGPLAKLLGPPNPGPPILTAARDATTLNAAKCLVALRRWQLTSTKRPTDLAAVCKAAKMPSVPSDPFGEGPLRFTTVNDEPVIYSVGPDGRDDGAKVEAEIGKKPNGDLIYRLPQRK